MSLEETWHRYSAANREYRRLLMRTPNMQLSDPEGPLARARKEEAEALGKYLRVLRDLTQLASDRELSDGTQCRL
jgi:hypothetical protein